jgi:hypothetical protein
MPLVERMWLGSAGGGLDGDDPDLSVDEAARFDTEHQHPDA